MTLHCGHLEPAEMRKALLPLLIADVRPSWAGLLRSAQQETAHTFAGRLL